MGEQPGTPSRWRERVRDWSSRADWELMEALKAGQPAALAALYDRYAGLVYGLAFKILGHVAEAEDLTQEVFVELWRKVGCDPRTPSESRERRGSLSSFLCILTRSRAIDRLRSQGSHQLLLKRWQTILSADRVTERSPIARLGSLLSRFPSRSGGKRCKRPSANCPKTNGRSWSCSITKG